MAVQGLGSVGFDLARRLHEAGARLHVADVDMFAPCALGAVINDQSVGEIGAKIVADQMAEERFRAA